MREILDPVDPDELRPLFGDVFHQLQRGKALEPFVFRDECFLLALDGTILYDWAKNVPVPGFDKS